MAISLQGCSVCHQRFEVLHGYQVQSLVEGVRYYCSQGCHEKDLFAGRQRICSVCSTEFELKYAYQQLAHGDELRFYCSPGCRHGATAATATTPRRETARIAVMNQKGGTGKTTTAVTLAAGLAQAGLHTLLIDLDAQGHVASSLGTSTKHGLYQLLVDDAPPRQCTTQLRKRLHAIIGDQRLTQCELWLAGLTDGREQLLADRLREFEGHYDFVIMDCGPAMSLLNLNALVYADHLLVPVSCDYLSLLGVKQMLKTVDQVNRKHGGHVEILGIVPTFYDRRNRISDEAVKTLRGYFRDKVLPPVRINTTLKEAPQHQKSIFEYAPTCAGAQDYRVVVEWVARACGKPTAFGVDTQPETPSVDEANEAST